MVLALIVPAGVAVAKSAFQTGPYLGSVSVKRKPAVHFTATKKKVKHLDVDAVPVRCSDGNTGTLSLPGTPAHRNLAIRRGRFGLKATTRGRYPAQAGTRLTGKLAGRKASGTIRVVLRRDADGGIDPDGDVKCDTGRHKWRAKAEEVVVELP